MLKPPSRASSGEFLEAIFRAADGTEYSGRTMDPEALCHCGERFVDHTLEMHEECRATVSGEEIP